MRRGTTPTHIFALPFDTSIVSDARVIYKQDGEIKLKKTVNDCAMEGNTLRVKLTREETLAFDDLKYIKMQLEVWTPAGDVLVSDVIMRPAAECLDDEV